MSIINWAAVCVVIASTPVLADGEVEQCTLFYCLCGLCVASQFCWTPVGLNNLVTTIIGTEHLQETCSSLCIDERLWKYKCTQRI